jgi:Uma2 family endonuclease
LFDNEQQMAGATAVSLNEYLNTSYRPDCEYLDGVVLERNVGEFDHSRLLGQMSSYLLSREKRWGILVLPTLRVQVRTQRIRVPDITVIVGGPPDGPIVTKPPFLCIEILSPSDRLTEMQERIDDYLSFGVSYVWLINPRTRQTYIYSSAGIREVRDGVLTTDNPDIRVVLDEL